ncbi:hypothetical protein B0H17DRAFT_1136478 [Mycena rosella]|uniref:Uncharacterized protein n=1 Tax=Mycena rosella TaxID=1033263 RepID=A0AAD7DDZ9_MYCRO|nr:hypothetical protein B0H17DRAFT_1136478 [Mycena rosella]
MTAPTDFRSFYIQWLPRNVLGHSTGKSLDFDGHQIPMTAEIAVNRTPAFALPSAPPSEAAVKDPAVVDPVLPLEDPMILDQTPDAASDGLPTDIPISADVWASEDHRQASALAGKNAYMARIRSNLPSKIISGTAAAGDLSSEFRIAGIYPGEQTDFINPQAQEEEMVWIYMSIGQESEHSSKLLCSTSNLNHPSTPSSNSLVFHGWGLPVGDEWKQ